MGPGERHDPAAPAGASLVGAMASGGSIVSRRIPSTVRRSASSLAPAFGSECYWAGLVGALLAVILVACAVGSEIHGPDRSASEVVRQTAR
jgi:hypothetical protein